MILVEPVLAVSSVDDFHRWPVAPTASMRVRAAFERAGWTSGPILFDPVWAAIDQCSAREQRTWLQLLAGDGRVVAATRSEAVLVGPDLRSAFSGLILADAPLTTLLGERR